MGNKKFDIRNKMGEDLFQRIYEFIKFNRRKGTDEALMHDKIKDMVNGDKRMLSLCFELDGLVFIEILNE